jgi:hypothetical protein
MPTVNLRDALIVIGVLSILLGFVPRNFYLKLPGLYEYKWKSVPRWLGRLWYVLIGMAAIYMGIRW